MSWEVKRAPLGSRLGTGFGQGLADQVPKEIENYRLKRELGNFSQNAGNMTLAQQLAQLGGIRGMTPQLLQSMTEAGKLEALREGYKRQAGQPASAGGVGKREPRAVTPQQPMENGETQIKNAFRPEAIPAKPWSQERKQQERLKIAQDFPYFNHGEIEQMAAENEQRELAAPKAEQEIDRYTTDQRENYRKRFNDQLSKKLQKTGEGVYEDVIGEMGVNLERGLDRELRTSTDTDPEDIVNKWTTKGLELAKAKRQLDELRSKSNWATPILLDKKGYRNKLEGYRKIFESTGNQEEYFNLLKSNFGFSPRAASYFAYTTNPTIEKEVVSKVKPHKLTDVKSSASSSRKYANDIKKYITPNDSISRIAYQISAKDPNFNQNVFFEELNDEIKNLTDRQKREVSEGSAYIPSWADLLVLPFFRS